MNKDRQRGRDFTIGVLDVLSTWALIVYAIYFIASLFIIPIDDCDVSKYDRCGMEVLTDNKTGIQYLSDGKGGLVRRGE